MKPINRRDALFHTAVLLGSTLTVPSLLSGCKQTPPTHLSSWTPTFLTPEEGKMAAQMAEHIIPRTADGPGAIDAQVYTFIDRMLQDVRDVEDGQTVKAGLKLLDETAKKNHQKAFIELPAQTQIELLKPLNQAAHAYAQKPRAERPAQAPFFAIVRDLTFHGFFTSEEGMKTYLAYDPIPGAYEGCIPLSETPGKIWGR